MIAVITGDIINSRAVTPEIWQPKLKEYLSTLVSNSQKWEIYRGDSFQLEVEVEQALEIVLCIKALIKSCNLIDVRMAIGIGEKDDENKKITESYGTAHIYSGEGFERLKSNTLLLKSPNAAFDNYFNPILRLVSFITDSWKPVTSETFFYALTNKGLKQKEMAERLGKDSTTINKALKRGAYDELMDTLDLFSKKAKECLD